MINNIKTIFFDYDGTLHDSIKIYAPSFRKAYDFLVINKHAEKKDFTDAEISYWLGFSSKDMWKNFMPNLDENIRNEASKIIGSEMLNQLSLGKAILYKGTLDVLKYLKNKGYDLVFISNCGINYMEMNRKLFNLDNFFNEMVCSEEYNYIPKYEILEKIKNKYKHNMVIIGDRIQDIESGKKNNIYSIACNYGYGSTKELENADLIIDDIKDIMKIFK